MKVKQLSVFIANRLAELAKLTTQLADFGINISAISVVDASDYGLTRMIVSDVDRAAALLREMGYGFVITEVVTAEIPDKPGALAELCKRLADQGVNIRYIYGSVTPGGGVALAVLSTENDDQAEAAIGS